VPRSHGSYEALLADDQIDAIYVSLPNSMHVEWSIRALEAGKHVLCEKPMSRHPEDVERAFDAAETADRVLMEAFMWRYTPQARRLVELLPRVGTLRMVRAAFSFPERAPDNIRLNPDLEGGALMDVGCYCLSGIRLVAGEPRGLVGRQVLGGGGVDVLFTGAMSMPDDVLAHFDCGMVTSFRDELEVWAPTRRCSSTIRGTPATRRSRSATATAAASAIDVDFADPYACELEELVAVASGSRPARFGRQDAVAQARAIEQLYAAARRAEAWTRPGIGMIGQGFMGARSCSRPDHHRSHDRPAGDPARGWWPPRPRPHAAVGLRRALRVRAPHHRLARAGRGPRHRRHLHPHAPTPCTPNRRSPPRRPASTWSARSRWAATRAESAAMLAAAEAAGVVHCCAFNYRFVPAVRRARDLLASGELGEVRHFRGTYRQSWGADRDPAGVWRFDANARPAEARWATSRRTSSTSPASWSATSPRCPPRRRPSRPVARSTTPSPPRCASPVARSGTVEATRFATGGQPSHLRGQRRPTARSSSTSSAPASCGSTGAASSPIRPTGGPPDTCSAGSTPSSSSCAAVLDAVAAESRWRPTEHLRRRSARRPRAVRRHPRIRAHRPPRQLSRQDRT
jgi:predicted dehydrogenase